MGPVDVPNRDYEHCDYERCDVSFQSHCPSVGVDSSGHKATPAVQLVAEIVMYDGIAVVIKIVF